MREIRNLLALAGLFFLLSASSAMAEASTALREHAMGKETAPITVIEYSSLTCTHCADFYTKVMPEIEKRYIETGKVRFIYRDFPVDGVALKGAALAHCMPKEQFFPFIGILYNNQSTWLKTLKREETLMQYAQMAGLPADKAKACVEDTKLMDALIAVRTEAMEKFSIKATPTFIINNGDDKIVGAQGLEAFITSFENILAKKK